LLQVLVLEGCIVTIDAMGTQKEIATTIIERGADYILALKGNQSGLFEDVQWLFEQAQAMPFQDAAHDSAQTLDKGHGRIEIRRCWTLAGAALDYLVEKPQWRGLNSVVMLQRERRIQGHTSSETHYYISSLAPNAAKILAAIRTHWTVENQSLRHAAEPSQILSDPVNRPLA
jgi:predicted transposase YbfD/YdcC